MITEVSTLPPKQNASSVPVIDAALLSSVAAAVGSRVRRRK
jgi:hypothetical protein